MADQCLDRARGFASMPVRAHPRQALTTMISADKARQGALAKPEPEGMKNLIVQEAPASG
jgi:hypothetical protein